MAAGLFAGPLIHRVVQYAIAGTTGNLMVKGAAKARPWAGPVARRLAVRTVAVGIVGGRRLGDLAEEARLQAGDVMADARASLGETAVPPAEAAESKQPAEEPGARPAKKAAARRPAPRKSTASNHGHDH